MCHKKATVIVISLAHPRDHRRTWSAPTSWKTKFRGNLKRDLPRILAAHPDIGRPAQLSLTLSNSERNWLLRLAPLTARRRLQAREWLLGEFWILYYRTASAVYLASARHEREAEYH